MSVASRMGRLEQVVSVRPLSRSIPVETRLKTTADVIELLREQIGLVRCASRFSAVEQARTVGYLLTVALKAIEAGTTAARIEELERILKLRSENQ
jgi:hypothetical protein